MANPSSALGPGFASSVKPDVLFPAREHLVFVRNEPRLEVRPAAASRAAGLRVAAPPVGGRENVDAFTGGTSAAAALCSRAAHRIHDVLEEAYGEDFLTLPIPYRAVLIKALLAHPARWPDQTASFIRQVVGPNDNRLHVRQKDNIRRFLGFGIVDAEDAVACAADRATFWAAGTLPADSVSDVEIPLPVAMSGRASPHFVAATLAWFTPVVPSRKAYRSVRLRILEPIELEGLAVKPYGNQPDSNQTSRGTVFTRYWTGDRAPVIGLGESLRMRVQRDSDQVGVVDEPIPFGLAVTLAMPGVVTLYDEVRQRLPIAPRPQP